MPIKVEIIPNTDKCIVGGNNQVVLNDQGGAYMAVSYGVVGTLRAEMGGHQPIVMENIPKDLMSTTGGAERILQQQGQLPHKLSEGQSTDIGGNGLEGPAYGCNCNGGQIAGTLCAHDGRGFNGQDVSDGKIILQCR